eukprot:760294-Hanusia_phi.AAC.3
MKGEGQAPLASPSSRLLKAACSSCSSCFSCCTAAAEWRKGGSQEEDPSEETGQAAHSQRTPVLMRLLPASSRSVNSRKQRGEGNYRLRRSAGSDDGSAATPRVIPTASSHSHSMISQHYPCSIVQPENKPIPLHSTPILTSKLSKRQFLKLYLLYGLPRSLTVCLLLGIGYTASCRCTA